MVLTRRTGWTSHTGGRTLHEMHLVAITAAGLGVGVFFGMFGAGGSAFATPMLALLGVPAPLAVASPLPAMLPASMVGARQSWRAGRIDPQLAALTVLGGVPGTIVGALASGAVDGRILLVLSGVMLVGVGVRLLVRDGAGAATRAADRRGRTSLVIAAAFGVGLLTGLLANGGGFLLVPLFVVGYGLSAGEAAGTSMLAVGALVVPTLVSHWALGHIDWSVSMAFATGLIPGSLVGSRAVDRIPAAVARRAFGTTLLLFAVWFLWTQA